MLQFIITIFLAVFAFCGEPLEPIRSLLTSRTVDSLEVIPDTMVLLKGETGHATCVPRNRYGTTLTNPCTWRSRDTTIVANPPDGAQTTSIKALKVGRTWVVAIARKRDSVYVAVCDAKMSLISRPSLLDLCDGGGSPPPPPPPPPGSCLSQAGPLTTLVGARGVYDTRSTGVDNQKIDATQATWTSGSTPYLIYLGHVDGSDTNFCFHGGVVTFTFPDNTTQAVWHGVGDMITYSPNVVVEDMTVNNTGDGIKLQDYSQNWTYRRMRINDAKDDCVENDRYYTGLLEDVLFDGCYVFLSSRQGSNQSLPRDGATDTVTIRNAVVHLKPMPTVYRGTAPGTGPLFKWDNLSNPGPWVVLDHVTFWIEQPPNHGDLNFPSRMTCKNGITVVWTGTGAFPGTHPSCAFTVTTDVNVWTAAKNAWIAAHPGQ